jgi:hypothetical protein
MTTSLHVDIFSNNYFVKKAQVHHTVLHLQHTRQLLSLYGFSNCIAVLALDFDTPVS